MARWRPRSRDAGAWPDVVDELFSRTPGPEWELVGCDTFSCEFVEPTPDDVDGARIRFGVAPDVDGDGFWYVGRIEISEGAPESANGGTMRYTGPPLSPGESWIDSDGFIWVSGEDGTPVNMGQGQ